MTVREHLQKAHETIAAHHRTMMKCHEMAMGKSAGDHEFHKAAHAAHAAAAAAHQNMCDECAKASEADLTKLVPTQVSGVAPTVRAIPRTGQREIPTATVDADLAKFVSIEDVEEISLLK
jgi:hypothetical protein